MSHPMPSLDRRGFFRTACLGALAGQSASRASAAAAHVKERTRASALKITDLRCAVLTGLPMQRVALIRIDTNQGISGLGEVRDGASPKYALMLKSRLLGENPCDVDRLFRKIKQFGGHGRQGGGVSAVEMALWDLAGKAYDVPVYQLLGGKFRDRIRLYVDTPAQRNHDQLARLIQRRLDAGFTAFKMDLGIDLLAGIPGTLSRPRGKRPSDSVSGVFSGIELTPKGIAVLCGQAGRARKLLGPDVALAFDHFGPIGVKSCIRLARALEKYTPAWLEDMVPWQYTDRLRRIASAVAVPILTGEDIYLKEEFRRLVERGAVDLIHPDLATAGGLLETKKIGDLAQEAGVGMVLHCAGSPVAFLANLHVAAATENFQLLEFHSADVPFWEDLVGAAARPIIQRGQARVPDRPGLGITLDDRECRRHLLEGSGYFAPTKEWDRLDSHDRTWS